jgi:hypothetical protein
MRSRGEAKLVRVGVASVAAFAASGVALVDGITALVRSAEHHYMYPINMTLIGLGVGVVSTLVGRAGVATDSAGLSFVGSSGKVGASVVTALGSAALLFGPARAATMHPEAVGLIASSIATTQWLRVARDLD